MSNQDWTSNPPNWLLAGFGVLIAITWMARFRKDKAPVWQQVLLYGSAGLFIASVAFNVHPLGYAAIATSLFLAGFLLNDLRIYFHQARTKNTDT